REHEHELQREAQQQDQKTYAAVRPHAKSLIDELRGLTVREGAARQYLEKPETVKLLQFMTGPRNNTTERQYETINKWTHDHRDRLWKLTNFQWEKTLGERITDYRHPQGIYEGTLRRDYPVLLDKVLASMDAIEKRTAAGQKGAAHNDVLLFLLM